MTYGQRLVRKLAACVAQTRLVPPERRPVYWRKRDGLRKAIDVYAAECRATIDAAIADGDEQAASWAVAL